MNKWPYYPDSISEVFQQEQPALLNILLSGIIERVDAPAMMLEFPKNKLPCFLYPEDKDRKYPEFCIYLKNHIPGGQELCLNSTKESVRKYINLTGTNREVEELPCHMGLTNYICPIVIRGKTVAYCASGKMLKEDDYLTIDNKVNELRNRLPNISDGNIKELKRLIKYGTPPISTKTDIECKDFKSMLGQEISMINGVLENQFLREKEKREREFQDTAVRMLARGSSTEEENGSNLLEEALIAIRNFLGTEYICVFSANEQNETVLPLVAQEGLKDDLSGQVHFNWRKAELPLNTSDLHKWILNTETSASSIFNTAVKGFNTLPLAEMSYFFPYSFAEGYRGVVILGPFYGYSFIQQERDFLNSLSSVLGSYVTTMTIMNVLRRRDRQRKLMISLTAHDIRSGLHSIVGEVSELRYLVGLERRLASDTERLETALEKVSGGIKQLGLSAELTMKNPDAVIANLDATEVTKEPYSLGVLVENCVERFIKYAKEKKADIELAHSLDKLPSVMMDVWLMEQAFTNLIDNAIKYSAKGKTVRIRGRTSQDFSEISITIENYGLGIAPEEMEDIFELGYRSKLRRPIESILGAGLGLFLVKSIIELHKGRIIPSSRKATHHTSSHDEWNYITEFTVTLPTLLGSGLR